LVLGSSAAGTGAAGSGFFVRRFLLGMPGMIAGIKGLERRGQQQSRTVYGTVNPDAFLSKQEERPF